ncbi:ribosome silencing factor [Thalassobaculum sp.]|uniref:ribosome silencing factor n=1 Tax=Thalassobaculum sp. TaxID=2022740 RepID=UPI0032EE78A9
MRAKERIITHNTTPPAGDGLLDLVTKSLDDDKAEDIVSIDLANKSSIGDHMVIATGRSARQVAAMADHLVSKLKDRGLKNVSVEGASQGDWVLIDTGDVIVHLFRPEVRDFYGLEKMWSAQPPPTSTVQLGDGSRTERSLALV